MEHIVRIGANLALDTARCTGEASSFANRSSVKLSDKNRRRLGRASSIVQDTRTDLKQGFSVREYMDSLYKKIREREAKFREELAAIRQKQAPLIGVCCLCDKFGNETENILAEDNDKLYCKDCFEEIHTPIQNWHKSRDAIANKYPLEFDEARAISVPAIVVEHELTYDNFASLLEYSDEEDDPAVVPPSYDPPVPDMQDPYQREPTPDNSTPVDPETVMRLQIELNLARMNLAPELYSTVMLAAELVAKIKK